MSRPTSSLPRNLSATEELEKLEQSITLTLQEIDQNFSKAHRIVTTSILPLVEQYGEQSRAVWDASKFWKQFFEASANVSLSGYEELNNDETTAIEESTAQHDSTLQSANPDVTASTAADRSYNNEDSLLDDAELSGSTPRPPSTKTVKTQFADLRSPYEIMRREMRDEEEGTEVLESEQGDVDEDEEENSTLLFQQRTARLPDMSMTPRSLLPAPRMDADHGKDPVFHRMLDKTYRLKSTPHKNAPPLSAQKHVAQGWHDSPMSSPEIALPKLRSEAFMSPYKGMVARQRLQEAATGPRTPGVSVQTPTTKKTKDVLGTEDSFAEKRPKYEIDWESDSDGGVGGISPPKTIQFALPPSKLLQTPAREASRRIVDDILLTAGAAPDGDTEEYSPTMVKMNKDILDDTF
ncbi:hypothetical protein jhhlp_003545 [Lomentospora prolificans]|uniref:DASH complex subunit ASK1 n=1 Tax=Lomentospora prolificans TaxID=41688 RepID=A0A2N3N980_9PEZI|nr:hypothetical protein jhhlp_003545 [Lomentospora prolificans]